jgi:hypothetical protein
MSQNDYGVLMNSFLADVTKPMAIPITMAE